MLKETPRTLAEIAKEAHSKVDEYLKLNAIPRLPIGPDMGPIPKDVLRAGYYGEELFFESSIIRRNEVLPENDR